MLRVIARLAIVLTALSACGGDGGGEAQAPIETLAYVVTECRQNTAGIFWRQELRIRQGEHDAISVAATPMVGPLEGSLFDCHLMREFRTGLLSVFGGAFQRLGVREPRRIPGRLRSDG